MSGSGRPAAGLRMIVAAAIVVIRHPHLWATALRQLVLLTPPRWWTKAPYLPVPNREYLAFRMVTAYGGDGSAAPEPTDLVAYLEWCRTVRTLEAA